MDWIQVLTTNYYYPLQKYNFSGCTTTNNICAPKPKNQKTKKTSK